MKWFFELATQDVFHAIFCGLVIYLPFRYAFKFYNRWIRHKNIAAHGYPPPHLDADGDFKPDPEPEKKEGDEDTGLKISINRK